MARGCFTAAMPTFELLTESTAATGEDSVVDGHVMSARLVEDSPQPLL